MNAFGPFINVGAKDSKIFIVIVNNSWPFPYQSTGVDRFYDLCAVNILFLGYFCWRIDVT